MSNIHFRNKYSLYALVAFIIVLVFFAIQRDFSREQIASASLPTIAQSGSAEKTTQPAVTQYPTNQTTSQATNLETTNNSASLVTDSTSETASNPQTKTFVELAEAYSAPFKARQPRPQLALYDEHAPERLNKIITNGTGCKDPANKQECDDIFNRLKTQADLGDAKAILQYGKSRLIESQGPLIGVKNFQEQKRQYEEGKEYLLKIGNQLSNRDASGLGYTGARFDSAEEGLAWYLIAHRLGRESSFSYDCGFAKIQCTPELFLKAKVQADAYIDLYQIDN